MTEYTLQQAQLEDAPAILACVCQAYAHYEDRMGKKPAPMLEDYREVLTRAWVHTAKDAQGELVGVLVLEHTPKGLFLDNVAVGPSAQGKGLGRILVGLAEEEAQRRGEEYLFLYTNELMWENQKIYEKLGYERYDHRVVNGYARIFYRKRLR